MKYVRFYGNNGFCGTDYEEYVTFEDDVSENEIDEISNEYAYENAETYEYMKDGWDPQGESEEDEEWYYENAIESCGWDYCSEEEYKENTEN